MRRLILSTGSSVHYLPTANARIRFLAPTILSSAPFPVPVPVSSYKYFNTAATAPLNRHQRNLSSSIITTHSTPRSTYSILNSTSVSLKSKSIHHNFATMASATNFFDFKVPNSKLSLWTLWTSSIALACVNSQPQRHIHCLGCLSQHRLDFLLW